MKSRTCLKLGIESHNPRRLSSRNQPRGKSKSRRETEGRDRNLERNKTSRAKIQGISRKLAPKKIPFGNNTEEARVIKKRKKIAKSKTTRFSRSQPEGDSSWQKNRKQRKSEDENAGRVVDILGLGRFPAFHFRWQLRGRVQLRKCQQTLRGSVGSGELCVPATTQRCWPGPTAIEASSTIHLPIPPRGTRSLGILVSGDEIN